MRCKLSSKFISTQSQSQWEHYFQRKDTMSNLDPDGTWKLNPLKLPQSRDIASITLNSYIDIAADSCDVLYLLNSDYLKIHYVLKNNSESVKIDFSDIEFVEIGSAVIFLVSNSKLYVLHKENHSLLLTKDHDFNSICDTSIDDKNNLYLLTDDTVASYSFPDDEFEYFSVKLDDGDEQLKNFQLENKIIKSIS